MEKYHKQGYYQSYIQARRGQFGRHKTIHKDQQQRPDVAVCLVDTMSI